MKLVQLCFAASAFLAFAGTCIGELPAAAAPPPVPLAAAGAACHHSAAGETCCSPRPPAALGGLASLQSLCDDVPEYPPIVSHLRIGGRRGGGCRGRHHNRWHRNRLTTPRDH